MEELINSLFTALEIACVSEGGDGDAVFICDSYYKAADAFENWLKQNNNTYWTRSNRDDFVTFSNSQECIYFVETRDKINYATHYFESRYDFCLL